MIIFLVPGACLAGYLLVQTVRVISQRQPVEYLLFWPLWLLSAALTYWLVVTIRSLWAPSDPSLASLSDVRSWELL